MRFSFFKTCLFVISLVYAYGLAAKEVSYNLTVHSCEKNLSGKAIVNFALCVNGDIPAPTLSFTEGDDAVIHVKNDLPHETSIHWHGILLPNSMDGISYVTTQPILAGGEHTFRFKIRQHGTFWYHSHTGLQEQAGVYGAFVIQPKISDTKADYDQVLILSDWTDENPDKILKNLKKDGGYYALKKERAPSLWDAYNRDELADYLESEWDGMGAMDLSDVGYDSFLANGKTKLSFPFAAHKQVRLRIINAAASTFFHVQLGQRPMTVVAADGIDVVPVQAKELLLGMAETYDVLVDMPHEVSLELRATAQDVSGSVSIWLGKGTTRESPPPKPLPSLYKMEHHGAHHEDVNLGLATQKTEHQQHHHEASNEGNPVVGLLTYKDLKNAVAKEIPARANTYDFRVELTGDMDRYVWQINNTAMSDDSIISIKEGDLIRFHLVNSTMMHHPMHLHGHFFRVLDGFDSSSVSPLKHTVNVAPHSTQIIEFYADEPGDWLFHCHNLYHMKSGMSRVVSYENFKPDPAIALIADKDPHKHEHWYQYGKAELFSSSGSIYGRLSQSEYQIDASLSYDWYDKFEGEALAHRWLDPSLRLFMGVYGQRRDILQLSPSLGAAYLLPFRIWSQISTDRLRIVNIEFSKNLPITDRITTDLKLGYSVEDGFEHDIFVGYKLDWHWQVGVRHHKSYLDLGAQVQF